MQTGVAHNDDVELHWVSEGEDRRGTVVLVNGAGSSSVMWCRELVDPLLVAGYRVVRFDNRDLGRSTRVPAVRPYRLADMAADLGAVVDAVGADAVHLLGRSMGGAIALAHAIARPDRVRSLVLVYTSPCLGDPGEYGLPGPRPDVLERLTDEAFAPPPRNDADRIARRVAEARFFTGTRYPFDEAWAAREAAADIAHAPHAETGHGVAVMSSPSLVEDLGAIAQPCLVLHGTADPIIDIAHGRLLADRLPRAQLIEYPGLGHEMPPAFCKEIVEPVLAVFAPQGPGTDAAQPGN